MAKTEETIESGLADEVVVAPAKIEVTRTELVWPGKYDENGKRREVERVSLPFQVIERVNESRATREVRTEHGLTLFDVWKGDEGETFEEGWRNKLIWGENKLVMSSLVAQFAGKVDVIYIDPPFAVGADFSFKAAIGDDLQVTKEQSIVEETAYRDTWGRYGPGRELDSYLEMMAPRLSLCRDLLSETGSLYVHVDYRASAALRFVLDEIFGRDCFLNEIIWHYKRWPTPAREYQKMHDNILCYVRQKGKHIFNGQYGPRTAETERRWKGKSIVASHDELGARLPSDYGGTESPGAPLDDTWDISIIAPVAHERTGFATQKPEALLERIILGSSNEGGLVADFFCGSGTTMAVAEKLGRRWVGCDLGRYAVHVSRKRLLDIEGCHPFDVLNLGKYERRYWQVAMFGEDLDDDGVTSLYEYVTFILKLYGAAPTTGLQHLHGKLGTVFVHVGAVDAPVTIGEVAACVEECVALKASELHVLGWEWEMGMNDLVAEEAKRQGVKVVLRQIPREVMEEQAAAKGDVEFFELAYLEASVGATSNKREYAVALENFVMPNPELVSAEAREKITKWSDYVDYWAVDWDFRDDTFMQEWVTYRTRKNRRLELRSEPHEYAEPGEYAVMVKVIDVFGNDTSKILRVSVS